MSAAPVVEVPAVDGRYVPHRPLPKQSIALAASRLNGAGSEPSETLYGGAAGGGKSDWLLMSALDYVHVPGYAALLLRRTYQDLAKPGALIDRAHSWLHDSDAKWNEQKKQWRFPSGAVIDFGYLEQASDVYQYQSAEYQMVGFDELTQFEEPQYLYLFSRLRRLAGFPVALRMCAGTNPGGIGHHWVKKRFLEARAPGRVFIPARLDDNWHVDRTAYRASLSHLSDELRRQLELGDWGAFEGQAFPDFDRTTHVLGRFAVPGEWERVEGMDHGVNNPTCFLAAALDYDGNCVVFDEYYAPGIVSDHAAEVQRRRESGWWQTDPSGVTIPTTCFGDPSIRNRFGIRDLSGRELSVETEYADAGIAISPGQNDRREGYARLRELTRCDPDRRFPDWHPRAGSFGSPRLFVTDRCANLVEQLEAAPIKPDGLDALDCVDPRWESAHGHATAALRYLAMGRFGPSRRPEPPMSYEEYDPDVSRRERVREIGERLRRDNAAEVVF